MAGSAAEGEKERPSKSSSVDIRKQAKFFKGR